MTVATAQRKTRINLREDIVRGGKPRVDRDAGIIYGVKILGTKSANGRTYLPQALKEAIPLYESCIVRINHPKRPTDSREVSEVFGKLQNVRQGDDGALYGDLHYLKSHPQAESICEAAERMPDLLGLSHNADGHEQKPGSGVIDRIFEVRSVDVVDRPATTKGLFEHTKAKPMKIKAFLEALKLSDKKKAKLAKALTEDAMPFGGEMREEDMLGPDGAEQPPEEMDPASALKAGFDAAIAAVLADTSLDAAGKVAKIEKLLHTHEELAADDDKPAKDKDEPEEELEEECETDKDMKESVDLQARFDKLEAEHKTLKADKAKAESENKTYKLCLESKLNPEPAVIKALLALESEADKKALLESVKSAKSKRPITQIPESAGGNGKPNWLAKLRSRN